MTKRIRPDLYAEVLAFLEKPHIRTHVMYKTFLNYTILREIKTVLLEQGFIKEENDEWHRTSAGTAWLQKYVEIAFWRPKQ